jgi:phospholipid/cholesterol/gamma-HCH transport system permease protein
VPLPLPFGFDTDDLITVRGARYLWRRFLAFVAEVGRVALLMGDIARFAAPGLRSFRLVVAQMHAIGVGSLGLVLVVSLFTGAVAAVQAAYQFSTVVPLKYIGSVILRSVTIELGPVLTGLVVGGRVGAAMAAELGTMKVTEQLDALRAMAIHPVRFLVVPRVVAAVVMLPVITVFANAIAVFGGYVVSVSSVGVSSHTYVVGLKQFFYMKDLWSGLIKAFFFGAIISTMGCYYGFATEGGAEGVGVATMRAVVASCVLILITDYVLANVLFRLVFAS